MIDKPSSSAHDCGRRPSILASQIGPSETHLFRRLGGNGGGPEHRNFLDCVKSRERCYAHEGIGHRAVAFAPMGNIVMMLGRKLEFDPKTE